jgi:hypothetical protein
MNPTQDPLSIAKYLRTTTTAKHTALIYGSPCTGKTTGATTFPDPYIVDFDNNLPSGTKNVIPMWNDGFVDSVVRRGNPTWPANRRDALLKIYADLAHDLTAGQTLITDSLTRIETWFSLQESIEPQPRSKKTGETDAFELFRKRLIYFDTLFTMLTSCAANVVFIAHQQQDRDASGAVSGQIKPALQGQIGEKLPGYFPIVLQAVRRTVPGTPPGVEFVWRIKPGLHEPARVPKPTAVDFIPQNYNELLKYL